MASFFQAATGEARPLRVVLYDAFPLVRQGLSRVLGSEAGTEVVGSAATHSELIDLVLAHGPDIAVIGIAPPSITGMELLRRLRSEAPQTHVLVLAAHREAGYAERALRAGARGFIAKEATPRELVEAIYTVGKGEVALGTDTVDQLLQQMAGRGRSASGISVLSQREIEVFELMGVGLTRREIAERLSVSSKTIDAYRARMKSKLGVRTMTELSRQAVWWVENAKQGTLRGEGGID